jgi:hypothetical protein
MSKVEKMKPKMRMLNTENVLLRHELVKLKDQLKKHSLNEKFQIDNLTKHILQQEHEISRLTEHLLIINEILLNTFGEVHLKLNEIASSLNELANENTQNFTNQIKLLELKLATKRKLLSYHKYTNQRYKLKLIDSQNQYKHVLMLQQNKICQLEKQIKDKEATKPKIIKKIDVVFKKFIQIKFK